MAKRFQPFNDYSRVKKPKLDITISRQRKDAASSGGNRLPLSVQATAQPEAANFWDDDDDDVILMATQVAESQVTATAAALPESEITFSEFAPNVQGTTSTQHLLPLPENEKSAGNPLSKDIVSAMFEDDDDFEFLVMGSKANDEPDPFKKPLPPSSKSEITSSSTTTPVEVATPLTSSQSLPSTSAQSQSTARRQLASERQIKFLIDRVDTLKKDNSKLQTELVDTKEQMMCKSGESSLLRDELRYLKQQVQALRMEKMMIAESTRSECNTKLKEMSKKINAKETELKLRDVEYSVLRMKHANDSRRFEASMCNESMTIMNMDEAVEEQSIAINRKKSNNTRSRRQQARLDNFDKIDEADLPIADDFQILCIDESDSCKNLTFPQAEFDELEKLYITLQRKEHRSTPKSIEIIKERVVASVCKVFPEFWSYVHNLEYPNNCVSHPYKAYKWSQDKGLKSLRQLTQTGVLFVDEAAICYRRYVALLALMCKIEATIATSLLQHKHGEYLLLQIANDAIAKLGYSDDKPDHWGLVEAFGSLLHSILLNYDDSLNQTQDELLFDLLKQLVFTCPNAWVFRELSACMLASTQHASILSQCCVNSKNSCFTSDRVRSTYRFSEDSCVLQVYAGLIEIPFFSEIALHKTHFELLTTICENHVRFVFNCLMTPPTFIEDILRSCDEIDVDSEEPPDCESTTSSLQPTAINSFSNNSTSSTKSDPSVSGSISNITTKPSTTEQQNSTGEPNAQIPEQQEEHVEELVEPNCECYVKLCLSLVTLIFQLLRHWLLTDKQFGTDHVAEISQLAVHVLNIIFREYYIILLFRDSAETTKHYLSLICTWWSENAEILEFKELHKHLLECLKEAHFMIRPIHTEGNLEHLDFDLAEWNRLVKNADASVSVDTNDPELPNALAAEYTVNFFDVLKDYEFNFE